MCSSDLSELARRRLTEPKAADYLNKIEIAGKHLLSIITNVLDLSKIESGGLELAHEAFSVREEVDSVFSLLAERASSKKINLVQEISATLPPSLVGDQLRVRQILVNLVDNAIKFSSDDTVLVRISSQTEIGRAHV